MRLTVAFAALAATVAFAAPAAAQQTAKVQAGILRCNVAPYVGFVLGSVREMDCEFRAAPTEKVVARYKGVVKRFGVDLGMGGPSVLGWGVFAPTTAPASVDLAGNYAGVSADAAWGIGGGANVLVGGSNNTIALQPVSVQGSTGINVAAGLTDLSLTPVVVKPAGKKAK